INFYAKKGNSSKEGSSNNILMEDNLPVNVQEYQELAKKLILKKKLFVVDRLKELINRLIFFAYYSI
ncbi:hypothetical protein ACJX0J_013069, partial [Zea mays]